MSKRLLQKMQFLNTVVFFSFLRTLIINLIQIKLSGRDTDNSNSDFENKKPLLFGGKHETLSQIIISKLRKLLWIYHGVIKPKVQDQNNH